MSNAVTDKIAFSPEEIDTSAPTRYARLKWVVVVNEELPPGRAVNAAICAAAATSSAVDGLLGQSATDADGHFHPGLPWAGCTVLTADAATRRTIRARAAAHEGTSCCGYAGGGPAHPGLRRIPDRSDRDQR